VLAALYNAHDAGTPVILYVDHLHRLLGGGGEDYPFDLTAEFKPMLYGCQIHLWGACTAAEYRATIEHAASMQRCFQEVILPNFQMS
jgi:ATP-dependent Clp protease ATP-binding subunit ClpA